MATSNPKGHLWSFWHVLNTHLPFVIAYLWQLTSTAVYTSIVKLSSARCRCALKYALADQGHKGIKGLSAVSLFLFACWQDPVWFTIEFVIFYKWIPLQAVDIKSHNSISWHVGLQLGYCSFLKLSSHCHSNKLHPRHLGRFLEAH